MKFDRMEAFILGNLTGGILMFVMLAITFLAH